MTAIQINSLNEITDIISIKSTKSSEIYNIGSSTVTEYYTDINCENNYFAISTDLLPVEIYCYDFENISEKNFGGIGRDMLSIFTNQYEDDDRFKYEICYYVEKVENGLIYFYVYYQ